MSEHINGSGSTATTAIASGGHVWRWAQPATRAKVYGSAGLVGGYRHVTQIGPRKGLLAGRNGRPALLKVSGASKAAAETVLDGYESALETLAVYGAEVAWEDDQGHSGDALVVTAYERLGERLYTQTGSTHVIWQPYRLLLLEMAAA